MIRLFLYREDSNKSIPLTLVISILSQVKSSRPMRFPTPTNLLKNLYPTSHAKPDASGEIDITDGLPEIADLAVVDSGDA